AGLSDVQARAVLASVLHEQARAREPTVDAAHGGLGVALVAVRKAIDERVMRARQHLLTLTTGFDALPSALSQAVRNLGGAGGVLPALADLGWILASAGLLWWLATAWTRRVNARLAAAQTLLAAPLRVVLHLLVDLIPVLAFSVLAIVLAAFVLADDAQRREFVIAYVTGIALVLLVGVLSRALFAPATLRPRPLPLPDHTARYAHSALLLLAWLSLLLWMTAGLVILTGVPMPVHLALVVMVGALLTAVAVWLVLAAPRQMLPGAAVGVTGRAVPAEFGAGFRAEYGVDSDGRVGNPSWGSSWWFRVVAVYVVLVYLLWAWNMLSRHSTAVWSALASIVLVMLLPAMDRVIARLVAALFASAPLEGPTGPEIRNAEQMSPDGLAPAMQMQTISREQLDEDAAQAQRAAQMHLLQSLARGLLIAGAVLVLLEVWGLSPFMVLGAGARDAALEALFKAAVSIAIGVVVWQAARAAIDPRMPGPRSVLAGDEEHNAPSSRTETLMPLLRKTVLVVVVLFTSLMTIAALGVEIGPLLAGAGVVGLAIGFGAQALVRDIVSGIFFLIDDAFRVGEYIEFGDLRGEVEAISLRSLKLRHHRGALHTVPFGELRAVTNYNRDWVIYKMEFRLPAETDVEKVRKLIKKLGQQLLEHPEHGDKFLQPLKSQGIHRVEENAIILRTKFMCKPREQFMIRREAYRQIQQVFKENGIELAPRTVTVRGGDESGGAAALQAAEGEPGAGRSLAQ
ncbi:MAG: mechanosensitive ion channel family protein, partial [Gammaproteobacteria bacterium]|nr:mechanosensitive ion channel family protein [Gammaproteobacteria bacterium]